MSLEIHNISFAWGKQVILKTLSITLKPGEFTGLLGPNGSGKSTLLKTILGFLKPSKGQILFSDDAHQGTVKLSPQETARRLAFVPQQSAHTTAMTVQDTILMGRLPHLKDRWTGYTTADKQLVLETMEKLDLIPLADRNVAHLSGGELQKVSIARCLVQEGDILLLDEATSGLDLNHTIEIMELMRNKADTEGKIILAVLHDLNLAAQYCDRIVLLKNGGLLCQGKPAEILNETLIETIYGVRVAVKTDECGCPFIIPRRVEKTNKEELYVC